MTLKMTAAFAVILAAAVGAVDYQAAAKARPGGQPLSLSAHVMNRLSQAEAALGLASPDPGAAKGAPAVPDSALGKALAVAAATLTGDTGAIFSDAMPTETLPAAVASGDTAAMGTAVQGAFGEVAAALDGSAPEPAPRAARGERPGAIKVGIGTCKKSGAGKFCSVRATGTD